MTDKNPTAQPVLTDEEILAATLYGQSEARMIRNGRAIESALLSKLRAPVAGERECGEVTEASAPVAGEAVAWRVVSADGRIRTTYYEAPDEVRLAAAKTDGDTIVPMFDHAAPQASEVVRDVNALMAAEYQQWIDWFHKGLDYDSFLKECVFNKPQADKDGGDRAKGAGDEHERLAFEAWAATEVPAHKLGRAPWPYEDQYNWVSMDYAWSMWRKIRAALSAQPAKEPANPKPSAAGNAGAAGVSSDPLTGKNNDGGANE